MSILIKGMEMPTDRPQLLWVYPNGKALIVQSDVDPWKDLQATPVPPHGRLIEAEPLIDYCKRFIEAYDYSKLFQDKARRHELLNMVGEIASAPTIIEAEGET